MNVKLISYTQGADGKDLLQQVANGTQKEHREIAMACADAIEPIFPMIKEFIL